MARTYSIVCECLVTLRFTATTEVGFYTRLARDQISNGASTKREDLYQRRMSKLYIYRTSTEDGMYRESKQVLCVIHIL